MMTYTLCGVFRLLICCIQFKKLAKYIGTEKGTYDENQFFSEKTLRRMNEIKKSVDKVSRYTPWQSLCLVKALTGMTLLRWFKIRSVLYLGLAKDAEEELLAHAWLKVGKYVLIGGEQMQSFKVINWYVG